MTIKIGNGRSVSIRTPEEEIELLEKELAKLTPEERKIVEDLIKSKVSNQTQMWDQYHKMEWKREPVSMEQFVLDPFYLGATCEKIFPKLLGDLTEIFSGNYHEVIFTGSIGYGKTFAASIGICRVLYEISCMVNPQTSFGIAAGSGINIVGLAVNEDLAKQVVFENIATKIEQSPYFTENFPCKQTKEEMRFPNKVGVWARPTTDTGALGLNAISAIIDETNFMPTTAANKKLGVDKAEVIYNQIKRRMISRFQRAGSLPGKLFVVSSKFNKNDFTDRLIKDSLKENEKKIFIRDYALWDVHPPERYPEPKFPVLAGNDQVSSKILSEKEKEELEKVPLPDGCTIVMVPGDFKKEFEKDIDGSLRDLAGVSVSSINPFMAQRDKITACINKSREHPFSSLVYDQQRGGSFLWESIVTENRGRRSIKAWLPRWNPKAPRHIHIDPGIKNDSLGLAMLHIQRWITVDRRAEDGRMYQEKAPFYGIDFMLRVSPPKEGEVILADIRRLIYELSDKGYSITTITADQFNSADMLQQLASKGYKTFQQSVDRTPEPYDNLKLAFYENRVEMYHYEPLIEELTGLESKWNGKGVRKIDHQKDGSKDLADAVAGAAWTLFEARSGSMTVPMLPSLQEERYEAWMPEERQVRPDTVIKQNTFTLPFLTDDDFPTKKGF